MHWLTRLFRTEHAEQQLDAEVRFHLERQVSEFVASGIPPQEARRRAYLQFGSPESVKQQSREARRLYALETSWQDVRFTLRLLRKQPGFAAISILTLALGIGANTALFSLLDALVLRNLDVPHPEQLVRFGVHAPGESYSALSLPMFQKISSSQTVFSHTFAWWGDAVTNVESNGTLARANTWAVDGQFFSELGAVPELGRLLEPADVDLASPAPAQLAVISHGFWQRRYGATPDILGQTLRIEGLPFTIVGVTRETFTAFSADRPPEVIIPRNAEPLLYGPAADVQKRLRRPTELWIEAAGRLNSNARLGQARAQLQSLWPAIQHDLAPTEKPEAAIAAFGKLQIEVESGAHGVSSLRERFTTPLYIVLGISGVVLLLACVNLAGLTLARAASRSHEMAARVALGASRARLIRQMLTESLVLSLAGAAAGFLFANWISALLASFILQQAYLVPASLNLSPDLRVLAFGAAVSLITGLLVGLAPAWRSSAQDPSLALQRSARGLGADTGHLGRALLIAQVALSVVLVCAAGLFVRSLANLHNAAPGFRTHGLLAGGLFPRPNGYKDLSYAQYHHDLLERVSQIPGVEAAGLVRMTPGGTYEWKEQVRLSAKTVDEVAADLVMLQPGSFRPLGIDVLQGRGFSWQDDSHGPLVAIISKSFAAKLFPDCSPLGQHFAMTVDSKWQTFEVVGVAADASFYNLRLRAPFTVYAPTAQYGDFMGYNDLILQTAASPAAIGPAVRQAVDSLGHEYVFSIKTVGQLIDKTFLQERVTALLAAFFGTLALLIAAIGLYGQMAYSVTQRTREIGIRVALGAHRSSLWSMVLCEALGLALFGVVIGLPCALAGSRLLSTLFFGVSARDPLTLLAVGLVLLAVGLAAAWFPARRAMRVDPIVALRHE